MWPKLTIHLVDITYEIAIKHIYPWYKYYINMSSFKKKNLVTIILLKYEWGVESPNHVWKSV